MNIEIERLAIEVGLTEFYIAAKVKETLAVAQTKGIDFSSLPVLVGFDAQGPQVRVIDANFSPLPTIQKAMMAIYSSPSVYKAIISGWDLTSLRYFRDFRLGIKEMGIIGELGAVFEAGGKTVRLNPTPEEKYYELKRIIFMESARAGLKIAFQGNVSNRVVDVYFEGDEPGRGDIRNHFLVRGTNVQTRELYELLREKEGFDFNGHSIFFEPSLKNIKEMDWVLSRVKPLNSVRLILKDEKVGLYRDNTDDKSFSLDKLKDFAAKITPADWEIDPNSDFCVDFIYQGDGFSTSKETAANIFARRVFAADKFVITNVGDKKGDILTGENTIFFPLIGTPAEEYCLKAGIPQVSVISAADYSLIMAAILNGRVNFEEFLAEDAEDMEDLFTL